jgi:alternate signal-mediated exported protein
MKNLTKGALVTGLGVALLLGGGGTLAVWNAGQDSQAGTITAGDLNLQAQPSVWTSSASGTIRNINAYRMVPGEKLTYTQAIDVTLVGSGLRAKLTVAGVDTVFNHNGFSNDLKVTDVSLVDSQGRSGWDQEVGHGRYTASASFELQATDRQDVDKTLNLSGITYQLTQIAPVPTPGAS